MQLFELFIFSTYNIIFCIGREFSAVVEFAPCQLVPKERQKKDHKTGTLEKGKDDYIYNMKREKLLSLPSRKV